MWQQRKDSFLLPSHGQGAADGGFYVNMKAGNVGEVHISCSGPTGEIIVMDGRVHKTHPWLMAHKVHPAVRFVVLLQKTRLGLHSKERLWKDR